LLLPPLASRLFPYTTLFRSRVERLADALDAPLGAGDRALRLAPGGRRREDDVGELSRLRQENVLHDQEVQALQELQGVSHIGLRSEEHTSELQSRENLVCRL